MEYSQGRLLYSIRLLKSYYNLSKCRQNTTNTFYPEPKGANAIFELGFQLVCKRTQDLISG